VKVKLLSRDRLVATPRTVAHQAPPSMGFSRQDYWSGLPLPSPMLLIRDSQTHTANLLLKRMGNTLSLLSFFLSFPPSLPSLLSPSLLSSFHPWSGVEDFRRIVEDVVKEHRLSQLDKCCLERPWILARGWSLCLADVRL